MRREKVTISYGNMCCLNQKVARWPLPFPGDSAYLWLYVKKIIDDLYIKNHLDPCCEQYRAPAEIGNIMSCEQTFTWLSRYKKILSAMPKSHHHFYALNGEKEEQVYFVGLCRGETASAAKVWHTNEIHLICLFFSACRRHYTHTHTHTQSLLATIL